MLSAASKLMPNPCDGCRSMVCLEESGKAGGDMTHADYFTTHHSLLAWWFTTTGHGLSRAPRVFFSVWAILFEVFLSIGLVEVDDVGRVFLVMFLAALGRWFVRLILTRAYSDNPTQSNWTSSGIAWMLTLSLVIIVPIIYWAASDAVAASAGTTWAISWIVGYIVEFIELFTIRKIAECCRCPCFDYIMRKH